MEEKNEEMFEEESLNDDFNSGDEEKHNIVDKVKGIFGKKDKESKIPEPPKAPSYDEKEDIPPMPAPKKEELNETGDSLEENENKSNETEDFEDELDSEVKLKEEKIDSDLKEEEDEIERAEKLLKEIDEELNEKD